MTRLLVGAVVTGLVTAAAVVVLLTFPKPTVPAEGPAAVATGGERPPPVFPVPEFRLTERSGKTVTKQDLLGKLWVASFVFTRCSGPCPAVTATVAKLQDDLKDVPDVRFVTFTVDPDRDDAGELKKYADRYRADPEKWLFLTGPEKTIHEIMRLGFMMGIERNPKGEPGQEFDHSTRLGLVNRRGELVGYFDGFPPGPGEKGERYSEHQQSLRKAIREMHD
jgi:protein SCO1